MAEHHDGRTRRPVVAGVEYTPTECADTKFRLRLPNRRRGMTQTVDYDRIAPAFDRRYERNRFDGVQAVLERFVGDAPDTDAAEVGCGTGHWLGVLQHRVRRLAGLDPSAEMLQRARAGVPSARVVRGRAEHLPWAANSFDRLFCINALHHFGDADAFLIEARRVLRPSGALMIIGLDPHTRLDSWWIYDYFPSALAADRARYLPAGIIRDRLRAAGFRETATAIAQHIPAAVPFAVAVERGVVDRRATSQLTILSDAEYEEGMRRLSAEQPILHANLRLYATFAKR
jgi:ubiquinone/menaquinone biosynthesis C-methylase UbiE